MHRILNFLLHITVLVLLGTWAAADVPLTTFQPGTTIVAAEVNANFQALAAKLAELEGALQALTGDNIVDGTLRLRDLGGDPEWRTITVGADIDLPAGQCRAQLTGNFGESYIGHMVIATLADPAGNPVLANTAAVVPSIVIGTTQGGAVPNIVVCNTGSSPKTVAAGSVFTWRMIAP